MSLFIASLNSGSNGNCYYVGNHRDAVLIDAGISCRETEKRMVRTGLSIRKVRAVFISHEHTDHTGGAEVFSRKHRVPVYMAPAAHENSRLQLEEHLLRPLMADTQTSIGNLTVSTFSKRHDASDPFSFTVSGDGITVGIFTDIGSVCDRLTDHFARCHAAFLEANYDEEMLDSGRYPVFLKNRIRSDHGHLSNRQALELFTQYKPQHMSHLLLSHLSKDNNNPDLVLGLFRNVAEGTHVAIASRYEETPVYCISASSMEP